MRTRVHKMKPDEVVLIKSASVKISEDLILMVLYSYHKEEGQKDKTFYRCDACVKSLDDWNKIKDTLVGADYFKISDLGANLPYQMFYAKKYFTKSNAGVWLKKKLAPTKIRDFEEFKRIEFDSARIMEPYQRMYTLDGSDEKIDILDIEKMKTLKDKWIWALKPPHIRKEYKSGMVVQ